jgi:hypothetical protein
MAGKSVAKKRGHWSSIAPPPERYRAFIDGELTVEDLDDEEIQRMQLRSERGTFQGRPPVSLPREFIMAMQVEQQRRFKHWINVAVPEAQKAILELTKSRNLSPGDATRLKAAEMIIERFAGKTPDKIEVKAEVSVFDQTLSDIIVDLDEEEAEVVE